jgi:hypothetical protein
MPNNLLVQTRSYWREALIGLLLLVIIVGSVATCRYTKKGVSEKSQKTIDSLQVTRPAHDSALLVTRQEEAAHVLAAETLARSVERLRSVAAQQRRVADSLAALLEWQAAYVARTQEADSLRKVADDATARAEQERFARLQADRRAALDSARNVALQKLALGLEKDANRAANCRIAGFIPCATRTQTFVAGAVLGGAGAYLIARK